MKRTQGALVIVFTERSGNLYRRVAGRRVTIACEDLGREDRSGFVEGSGTSTTFRAPEGRRAKRLWTGDANRGYDWCQVFLPRRTIRRGGTVRFRSARPIVAIPLTQRGAVVIDEERKAWRLLEVLALATFAGESMDLPGFPPPGQLMEFLTRGPKAWTRVVAMAAPGDTPPPGRFGYYSDGREHAAVALLSASGRRLFIEVAADDVVHTNVLRQIDEPRLVR